MPYDIVHNGGDIDRITVTDTATEIIPATDSESIHYRYIYLRNIAASNTIWMAIGVTPEVQKGIQLKAGEIYEFTKLNMTNAKVSGICESGKTANIVIQEGH